jgi:hypothetical protein
LICCGGKARKPIDRELIFRRFAQQQGVPRTLFNPSIRDATFTVFPITVNSILSDEPMLPTIARGRY